MPCTIHISFYITHTCIHTHSHSPMHQARIEVEKSKSVLPMSSRSVTDHTLLIQGTAMWTPSLLPTQSSEQQGSFLLYSSRYALTHNSLLTIILMMFTFSVVLASSSSHQYIFISLLSLLCNTLILQFAIELGNTVVLGRIRPKKIYDKDILSLIERRTSGYALKPFHIGAVHSSHKCYCWKHRPADLLFSYILS